MKRLIYLLPLVLFACGAENQQLLEKDDTAIEIKEVQTEEIVPIIDATIDVVDELVANDYTDEAIIVGDNVVEGKKETEVKMEIVTFCECVKKQHEIDEKMEAAEADAEIDAVMAEMDDLAKGPCKALLGETQTTPEQRTMRKQRIAECLAK
jgi:hypothetical protein